MTTEKTRGATRRAWIKLYLTGWLHGSIRWQLEPEERGVWADLICLAGECGKAGRICDNDGKPYPQKYLASMLNIPTELLDRTIEKCKNDERINVEGDILVITNWKAYQSEYERQKVYRDKEVTVAPSEGNIFILYENLCGSINPSLVEELKDAEKQYPADHIVYAFKQATDNNVRKWAYVKAILQSAEKEGIGKKAAPGHDRNRTSDWPASASPQED